MKQSRVDPLERVFQMGSIVQERVGDRDREEKTTDPKCLLFANTRKDHVILVIPQML